MIFLDVDGPLLPFGMSDVGKQVETSPAQTDGHPLLARLNREHGRQLLALQCDLVWATTWMSDANEVIAPRLGLPQLPVVTWPDETEDRHIRGLHWKTPTLVSCASGRSFVWIDDEITDTDRLWVAMHHDRPALPLRVDARVGLTDADFLAVSRWLESPTEGTPSMPSYQ